MIARAARRGHACGTMAAMSESTTHFGYREVPESEKAKLVGRVFT